MGELTRNTRWVHSANAVASGTTNVAGSEVDMSGWDGVVFVCDVQTATSDDVNKLTAQMAASTTATFEAIANSSISSTAGQDNMLLVTDCYKPGKRYVRPLLTRGSTGTSAGAIVAVQYHGKSSPVSWSSSSAYIIRAVGGATS